MKFNPFLATGLLAIGLGTGSHAALQITNGNLESGAVPNTNLGDVPDWFDANPGNFWEATWLQTGIDSPNGTGVAAFSAIAANETIDGAGTPSYLYQSIGTADGAGSVTIQFQWGSFANAPLRDVGITVGIYASDGTFVAGDGTDVDGATGITLLDQKTRLELDVAGGTLFTENYTFDLSAAGTSELFLRFNNYEGPGNATVDEAWVPLDNVVIVSDAPVFTLQPPAYLQPDVGSALTLTAAAVSDPAPSYQWWYDDGSGYVMLSGETNASLVIDPVDYNMHYGWYQVVADNGIASATSAEAWVVPVYPPPTIDQQPSNSGVFASETATLSVTATGLGNLTYQWFNADGDIPLANGGNIMGADGPNLQFLSMGPADEGDYYVVITDDAGVADTSLSTEITSNVVTAYVADLQISASTTPPSLDSFDEYYFPGTIADADNIAGGDDYYTFVAFDRVSQGMTFTTGSDPMGYTLEAISVQQVLSPTAANVLPGDSFEFHFGSLSGTSKTILYETSAAAYAGDPVVVPWPEAGTGIFFTFDLSGTGIGTLTPNTTYYFEITTEVGDPFFDWNGTAADNYAGGGAFGGDTIAGITPTYLALTGDRAFHAALTGLSGPADDFATWIGGYPVGAENGFEDDPENDGLSNGEENFFGTNPTAFNKGVVEARKVGNTFVFEHPQNATPASDVSAAYRWSTNLSSWLADGASSNGTTVNFSASPDTPVAGTTTVTAMISGAMPVEFFADIEVTQTGP